MSYMNFQIYPTIENGKVVYFIGTSLHNKSRISCEFEPRPVKEVLEFIEHTMKFLVSAEIKDPSVEEKIDDYNIEQLENIYLEQELKT